MCGIAGIVDLRGHAVDPRVLRSMADAIRYRGPDDEGYVLIDGRAGRNVSYCGPATPKYLDAMQPPIESAQPVEGFNIALSHRLFAIDDPSAGHQPMFSGDRLLCAVFDGRIYNCVELREELEALGVTFQSRSDAEVLLESYREWDTDCFSRFNGSWAIALYDFRRKRLILSRDRLGKKALYWTRVDDRVFFASEIKSLLTVREVATARRVNEAAVWHWCVEGRRDLDNSTFFANIQNLPAACWTVVDYDFPDKTRRYWELPRVRLLERLIGVGEAIHLLRESIDDAVRIRMRGDAPIAIELSGGLDSSTVLALAARRQATPLTAYTVRRTNQELDIAPFARAAAERYGANHRVLEPDAGKFWSRIGAFTYLQDEPYHSPNLHASLVARSHMRSDGTKVVLNGAGGDELFAGSARYYGRAQFENFLRGRWLRFALNTWHRTERRDGFWAGVGEMIGARGLRPLMQGLKRSSLWLENHPLRHLRLPEPHYAATLSDCLYREIGNTSIPYWLRAGEKTYMGIPMEVRCPYLDHRVVEIATRLPTSYLIRDGWHKWILRMAMEDLLPEEVVWRRAKRGSPDPQGRFFDTDRDMIELVLSNADNPYVDSKRKEGLRTRWNIVSFLLWYEYFMNANRTIFEQIEHIAGTGTPPSRTYVPEFEDCFAATVAQY